MHVSLERLIVLASFSVDVPSPGLSVACISFFLTEGIIVLPGMLSGEIWRRGGEEIGNAGGCALPHSPYLTSRVPPQASFSLGFDFEVPSSSSCSKAGKGKGTAPSTRAVSECKWNLLFLHPVMLPCWDCSLALV